jgi:hypothetical protein
MALRKEKSEAIKMRKEGASYSQIKEKLRVSKSTLSLWLRGYPLSDKRMRELRDNSEIRIEHYRETMFRKRESRLSNVRAKAMRELGSFSKRELIIGGLFLYWGEGSKTTSTCTSVSNTDPAVLVFFIEWLRLLGVPKENLRIKIHLYKDMSVKKELRYWSRILCIPLSDFRKPYIKDSLRSGLSYPQRFTHGTCNVIYENRDVMERVLMSLDCIRSQFAPDLNT